jgi:hypothetical protein
MSGSGQSRLAWTGASDPDNDHLMRVARNEAMDHCGPPRPEERGQLDIRRCSDFSIRLTPSSNIRDGLVM